MSVTRFVQLSKDLIATAQHDTHLKRVLASTVKESVLWSFSKGVQQKSPSTFNTLQSVLEQYLRYNSLTLSQRAQAAEEMIQDLKSCLPDLRQCIDPNKINSFNTGAKIQLDPLEGLIEGIDRSLNEYQDSLSRLQEFKLRNGSYDEEALKSTGQESLLQHPPGRLEVRELLTTIGRMTNAF